MKEERGNEEVRGCRAAVELGWIEMVVSRSTAVCYKLYPVLVLCQSLSWVEYCPPKPMSTGNLRM